MILFGQTWKAEGSHCWYQRGRSPQKSNSSILQRRKPCAPKQKGWWGHPSGSGPGPLSPSPTQPSLHGMATPF